MALNVFNRKQLVHFTGKNKIKIQLIAIDKKRKASNMGNKQSLYCILFGPVSGRDKDRGKTLSSATVTRHAR